MRTATLLLVGPNKLSRAGLKSLFKDSSFTVVGEVSGIDALADMAGALRDGAAALPVPDVALVECPGAPGAVVDMLECLAGVYPEMPAVVLSDKVCMETLAACLAAGAGGLLTKDISRAALLSSLQLVVLGETVFPTCLAGLLAGGVQERQRPRIAQGDDACGLSDREIETVQCLLRGESNKLIAKRLSITEATIKVHIKSVLRKIKASNRTQAAIWAYSHGYLPVHDGVPGRENEGQFGLD
jgi:two-component system nitrate/nitrite response regulator NarL